MADFVGLEVANEVPVGFLGDEGDFGFGFLDSVFSEGGASCGEGLLDRFGGMGFGHRHKSHGVGWASRASGGFGDGVGEALEAIGEGGHGCRVEGLTRWRGMGKVREKGSMYIQTLQVFCDLAETGSFSRAAERNGVSQSAVSQQIRTVERELGVTLVYRARGGVSLTAEGEIYLQACREMLAVYRALPERLSRVDRGVEGAIRVGAVYSIGLYELPRRVRGFREMYPGVEVRVEYQRAAQVYAAVLEGSVDVGLVAFPTRRKGLYVEVFDQDDLVLICAPEHPLAKQEPVLVKDLAAYRFVAFEPDLPTRKALDRTLRGEGVRLVPHLEFDNVETVKRAVRVEGGISIVPRRTALGEVESGALVMREVWSPPMVRPLGMVFGHHRARPPGWRAFLEALRKRVGEGGEGEGERS